MKSRIAIEVDFDNGNLPVIKIISVHSDDIRDRLIQNFLQSLQHTSRWCKIGYVGDGMNDSQMWDISPIQPKDLSAEMLLMNSVLKPDDQPAGEWVLIAERNDRDFEEYLKSANVVHSINETGIFLEAGTQIIKVVRGYTDLQNLRKR